MVKYGPILKFFLLKCQAKLEFFKMGDEKYLLGKYPSYGGKTKITIVNSLMNFIRRPPTQPKLARVRNR
jgi:hypothetical protein